MTEEGKMTAQSIRTQLAQHPFSKDFKSHQIDRLASLAREVSFAPEQIIFRSGDECPDFHLIVSGRVALEMPLEKSVLRIQTLSAGDEFGFSTLILGRAMTFQARALEPVKALAVAGRQLLESCHADPAFGFELMRQMLQIASERLDATRLQLMDTHSLAAARAGN